MPSQYPGGQTPYSSQVFLFLPFKFSLDKWIMLEKGTTPLPTLEISLKQRKWSIISRKTLNFASDRLHAHFGPSALNSVLMTLIRQT